MITDCFAQKKKKEAIIIPTAPEIVYEIVKGEMFFESAIKITGANTSSEGVIAETKYMEYQFGIINVDFKPFGSEFYTVNNKIYNMIHIQILNKKDEKEGEFRTLFFDVTDCTTNEKN